MRHAVQDDRMPGANVIEPSRLEWGEERPRNLFCRRIAHNPEFWRFLHVGHRSMFRDGGLQRDLVARIPPRSVQWSFTALLDLLREDSGASPPGTDTPDVRDSEFPRLATGSQERKQPR